MPPSDSSDAPQTDSGTSTLRRVIRGITKDLATTLLIVALLGSTLFLYTGLWPPFVSIVSGSMEPDMERGDLVLIMEPDRVDAPSEYAHGQIVTHAQGEEAGVKSFGDYGHVIIFTPNGADSKHDVIHRAMFHVEKGEDWTSRADSEYMTTTNCLALEYCPAPNDGFITKGDANGQYDQVAGISGPVPANDVIGIAQWHIPYLGQIQLMFGS